MLIELSANPMFILERKIQAFREDAGSMPASDIGETGFFFRNQSVICEFAIESCTL
jgi:hypothetical protein